jgi:hypothetical protein
MRSDRAEEMNKWIGCANIDEWRPRERVPSSFSEQGIITNKKCENKPIKCRNIKAFPRGGYAPSMSRR